MAGSNACGSIKWGGHQLGIVPQGIIDAAPSGSRYNIACQYRMRGIQSIGYDPNVDQTPNFEIGQIETYEINEGVPSVDITISKSLDGYCPVYLAATAEATSPTLLGRSSCKATYAISYFDCTNDSAEGTPLSTVVFPETQINSIGYTFNVDGAFTEDISSLGNNVLWFYDPNGNSNLVEHLVELYPSCSGFTDEFLQSIGSISFSGCFDGTDTPNCNVAFKENFIWGEGSTLGAPGLDVNGSLQDCDLSVVPQLIPGIDTDGVNRNDVCFQSISVSADLNREELFCLGRRGPITRTITPPIAVTTTFELVSEQGPPISFAENGICLSNCVPVTASGVSDVGDYCTQNGINLPNYTIRLALCEGLRIYTGTKNKLLNYSVSGASTGGENLSVSLTFQTYNTLTVLHSNDSINPSGGSMWNARDTHLGCA